LQKKAFTLIELLIVIVIMGVIYTLAINNFDKLKDKSKNLSLTNLKEYLTSQKYKKDAEFMCFNRCLECSLFIDGEKTKDIDSFLDQDIKRYRYDFNYGYVEVENKVYFNEKDVEQDVCFSYKVDKNGVGEQLLIEYKNKFYDFSEYFEGVKVYNSLDEVTEQKEKLIEEVKR